MAYMRNREHLKLHHDIDEVEVELRHFTLHLEVNKRPKDYSTGYSQAVTLPSTDPARRCLTSVIGRELVLSAWYGRSQG